MSKLIFPNHFSQYRLRRRVQRIEYKGLHVICFNCGCYGHKDEMCKQELEVEVVENQTTLFVNPVFQGALDFEIRPKVEEDFGHWMQVKKNWLKPRPATTRTTVPSEMTAPTEKDGKGNRFSIFVEKESKEVSAQTFNAGDSLPLKDVIIAEDVAIGISALDKENIDPRMSGSASFSGTHEGSPTTGLGMGFGRSSNESGPSSLPIDPQVGDGLSKGFTHVDQSFAKSPPEFIVFPATTVSSSSDGGSKGVSHPPPISKKGGHPSQGLKNFQTKVKEFYWSSGA
ncbi:hypothetical protein LINPERHAP2_LOCUS26419 [Linum perenne]